MSDDTTPENLEDLGRRAVACKHWLWMPGMSGTLEGARFRISEKSWEDEVPIHRRDEWYPDLTDPATLGCLLALVREAWGDSRLTIIWRSGWIVEGQREDEPAYDGFHPTEAGALVSALGAAP